MRLRPDNVLNRASLRPSAVFGFMLRLGWVLVAVLHARLLFDGNGAGLGTLWLILREALCLAAVVYATLKVQRISTWLDLTPRRALAFFGGLMLLHAVCSFQHQAADPVAEAHNPMHMEVVLILGGLSCLLGLAPLPEHRRTVSAPRVLPPYLSRRSGLACLALLRQRLGLATLRHRPPPVSA